jgi:hypothetical protein
MNEQTYVRFQVLTAANMKMTVFWDVAPCCLLEVYRRLRGVCCLHHQGDHFPDDRGSKHLWNVDKRLPDYTEQHPRRQSSSNKLIFEIWGSHGGEDVDVALVGCNAMWTGWRWRQYVHPKRWYLPISQHCVTVQNNIGNLYLTWVKANGA